MFCRNLTKEAGFDLLLQFCLLFVIPALVPSVASGEKAGILFNLVILRPPRVRGTLSAQYDVECSCFEVTLSGRSPVGVEE